MLIQRRLRQIVEQNAAHVSFVLGVVGGIPPPPPSNPKGLVAQLGQRLIDTLAVSSLSQRAPCELEQAHTCMCDGPPEPWSAGAVDALELADFVSTLLDNGAESVVASLTTKITADVGLIPPPEFTTLWLPFLRHLINVLERHGVPLSTPQYHDLFAAVLETYLDRCVGPRPFTWAPKFRKVHCLCKTCSLFNRFLRSNVIQVSFGAASRSDMHHINQQLVRYAYKSYRCRFNIEFGVLIARKQNDEQTLRDWTKIRDAANIEVEKLDMPALQKILGHADYLRIRLFPLEPAIPGQSSPIPIETLEEPRETSPVNTPQAPSSTPPTPLSRLTLQYLGSSCPSNDNRGSLLTPATVSTSHLPAAAGYDLFADKLGARLRTLSSFKTPESIKMAIDKRWEVMDAEERQPWTVKAAKTLPQADGTEAPPGVPFNPHRDRVPSTPKPSPHGGSTPSHLTTSREPRNPASGRAARNSALSGRGQPISTPVARVTAAPATPATQPAASSSPTLARVSLSRLNSIVESRRQKIKTEGPPQATPCVAKRKVMEYIDLTEDD